MNPNNNNTNIPVNTTTSPQMNAPNSTTATTTTTEYRGKDYGPNTKPLGSTVNSGFASNTTGSNTGINSGMNTGMGTGMNSTTMNTMPTTTTTTTTEYRGKDYGPNTKPLGSTANSGFASNTTGSNTGMNSGMNTGMSTGMNSGMGTGMNSTTMNTMPTNTGMNSVTMNTMPTTTVPMNTTASVYAPATTTTTTTIDYTTTRPSGAIGANTGSTHGSNTGSNYGSNTGFNSNTSTNSSLPVNSTYPTTDTMVLPSTGTTISVPTSNTVLESGMGFPSSTATMDTGYGTAPINTPMSSGSLSNKVLFVVSSHTKLGKTGRKTGWHLSELAIPYEIFTRNGFDVDFMSPNGGNAYADDYGWQNSTDPASQSFMNNSMIKDQHLTHTLKPSKIHTANYRAIYFVGGHGAMWDFNNNKDFSRIVSEINARGGIVGAICHGPAGLLDVRNPNGDYFVSGRKMCCFTNDEENSMNLQNEVPFLLQNELRDRGAQVAAGAGQQENVVVDGNLVTGQNPASASRLAEEMVRLLNSQPMPTLQV